MARLDTMRSQLSIGQRHRAVPSPYSPCWEIRQEVQRWVASLPLAHCLLLSWALGTHMDRRSFIAAHGLGKNLNCMISAGRVAADAVTSSDRRIGQIHSGMSRYPRRRYHIQRHAIAFPIPHLPALDKPILPHLITITDSRTTSASQPGPLAFFSVASPSRRYSIASAIQLGLSRRALQALRALIAQALVATDGPTLEENQFDLHHPSTSTTHNKVVCFSPASSSQSFVSFVIAAGPVGQCLLHHEHRNCNGHKPEPLHGRRQWRLQTKRPHA